MWWHYSLTPLHSSVRKRWTFQMSEQVLFAKSIFFYAKSICAEVVRRRSRNSIYQMQRKKRSIHKDVINIIKMRFKCHIKSFVMEMSIFCFFWLLNEWVACEQLNIRVFWSKYKQRKVYVVDLSSLHIYRCLRKHQYNGNILNS